MFTVILTVILIMPPDVDDVKHDRRMASIEECSTAAQAWIEQDAHAAGHGVVGFAAMCGVMPIPGRDG